MTKLGEYLARRSVSKAALGRKTGITRQRISELCLKDTTQLGADEFYLIALAIKADQMEMLKELYGHLVLKEETQEQPQKEKGAE
jgi:hypothetical protein